MKIALLSSGLGHIKRGIETWTEDLYIALKEREIEVTVYCGESFEAYSEFNNVSCLKRTQPFSQWLLKSKLPILWKFGWGGGYMTEQITFVSNILPVLKKEQYDIIHTQDPFVALKCDEYFKKGFIRSKTILAHGTEEPFEFLDKISYLQHLAPYHQQEAKQNGVKNVRSFAVGNFVDTIKFSPDVKTDLRKELGILDDVFVILSVAAIKCHHKRIDYLIDEIYQIKDNNVYLLVAGGRESDTDELIQIAKEKLGDRAKFLVNFPRERIPEVYASADIFTLCSLKEMMPIALLEAISSGLPAIINKYPVEEWMIGDGGDSIDMNKKGELACTILKYMDNNYLKEKSIKARKHAVDNFSKNIIVDQIVKMYKEVLGN